MEFDLVIWCWQSLTQPCRLRHTVFHNAALSMCLSNFPCPAPLEETRRTALPLPLLPSLWILFTFPWYTGRIVSYAAVSADVFNNEKGLFPKPSSASVQLAWNVSVKRVRGHIFYSCKYNSTQQSVTWAWTPNGVEVQGMSLFWQASVVAVWIGLLLSESRVFGIVFTTALAAVQFASWQHPQSFEDILSEKCFCTDKVSERLFSPCQAVLCSCTDNISGHWWEHWDASLR